MKIRDDKEQIHNHNKIKGRLKVQIDNKITDTLLHHQKIKYIRLKSKHSLEAFARTDKLVEAE